MPETERPLRADARRNRARIMASARELFALRGREAQMEEIAAHCGLGIGTLYRHFPSKQALFTAMVRERYEGMADLARAAERIEDPGEAFETALRSYLEAADGDASFQLALMGAGDIEWEGLERQKAEFGEIVTRIIERAVAAGALRADFGYADFPLLTRGVMATMYFRPVGGSDWRRHLELALDGVRGEAGRRPAG
ncbi:TetR/AcrR family transcriptional regulator [Phaeacidiphilus oryzae]|jgi:AcrR family transcriptional regulator|uniref:TetR/AcrR family transcriptional regulator n=1 Tax=Phaeacidiphilus oryzae TaxID=348818 RepID=UPI000568C4EF|nr:TetR/AcrR family transcriptional regulator [Phaeacidiphilus oryzae]